MAVVLSTVFVTSIAVTSIATQSTAAFLRERIDEKFPEIVARSRDRIELWYGQRSIDLTTLANSETLVEQVPVLLTQRSGASLKRARRDVTEYLAYVLGRFPQYEALFLLDSKGKRVIWVGADVALPDAVQAALPSVETATVSDLIRTANNRTQIVSAPVGRKAAGKRASLHAVMRVAQLDSLLADEALSASGQIVVTDRHGEVLAPLGVRSSNMPRASARPSEAAGAAVVTEYIQTDGESVIGSGVVLDRFGWTLWVLEPYADAFAPVVSLEQRVWALSLAIVVLFGTIAWAVARSLIRPVQDLSRAAVRIADGDEEVALPVTTRADEVGVLTRALSSMMSRLEARTAELKHANAELGHLAVTDELTRLPNHRAFRHHMELEIERASRSEEPFCLVLVDIDDFKRLNDTHGHAAGDRVLTVVAARMQTAIRSIDFLARYGGEEFALITPSTELEGARKVAEKLRAELARTAVELDDSDANRVVVTASFGIAVYQGDEKAMFKAADEALYEAKRQGKDCVVEAGTASS